MEEYRIDPNTAYDVVELPSKGIHYTNKKKSVKVAYLTAADENILSSPNFIETNTVVEELLKRKVLERDINVDDLVEEDRQAILIFLRNTAFGTVYKFTTTDPKTGLPYDVEFDLSVVKVKDFNLVEDVNGEYEFLMPKSNVPITFKFLTKKQEIEIEKIKESWNGVGIAPIRTKELEFMIKSIKGNKDPMNIRNFIENLPISDSHAFRKYVNDNKPGLDLIQKVTTPSGEEVQLTVGFGVDFFRPFYGL